MECATAGGGGGGGGGGKASRGSGMRCGGGLDEGILERDGIREGSRRTGPSLSVEDVVEVQECFRANRKMGPTSRCSPSYSG